MAENVKLELDAAPSSVTCMGVTTRWRRNQHKLRSAVLTNTPQGAPPATPKFNGTCDDLKGRSIVFESANPRADRFAHVKHKIDKYTGKEYTNNGDVRWTLERKRS